MLKNTHLVSSPGILIKFIEIMIQAEIITIGEELLIGQVVDTNSPWMGQKLNEIGIRICHKTSVGDIREDILHALSSACERAELILITGGLGPTRDDITKKVLCEFLDDTLRLDDVSLKNVERLFRLRGTGVTELNHKQAEIPSRCRAIENTIGTAPGMWMEEKGKLIISMPGVPAEMKLMMSEKIFPALKKRYNLPSLLHRTVLTQGIGESALADLIDGWEVALPDYIKLAYLPASGMVRLRLSGFSEQEDELRKEMDAQIEALKVIAGNYVFGYENDTLESVVGSILRKNHATLSTAESCTGGYIAHRITSVPGSSDYYLGSVVAYANQIKESILAVDQSVLLTKGAVSEVVVRKMAEMAREKLGSDYAIATTGIAGPSGATAEKPVGYVWIAVSGPQGTIVKNLMLGTGRERVIRETCLYALNLLRKYILGVERQPARS